MLSEKSKLLSIAIPCYNSQDYVRRALDTVVPAGDRVEILVVDDGSTDGTADIAREYEEKYPDCVRYFHKENGGHGDAVMFGADHATGFYFRVLDSDDWLNTENLNRMLDRLEEDRNSGVVYDLVLTNYVYEKVGCKSKEIGYSSALPVETAFTWDDTKKFNLGQNLLMHSITYRREMLLATGLRLPKHTFYVDNLFAYYPLPFVKSIFYFNFDLYHYYIGRTDQSVCEDQMIKRVDQQVLIANTMYSMHDLKTIKSKKLRRYMAQYVAVISTIVSALYVRKGGKEAMEAKREFWSRVKTRYGNTYQEVCRMIKPLYFVRTTNRFTSFLINAGYVICRKIFHFN